MIAAFAHFLGEVQARAPRAAVVLGSGLAGVRSHFHERLSIPFGDIPGLVPPTVPGHAGRLALGDWSGSSALVCFGRLHFYEGHSWEAATAPIRIAAEIGVRAIVLTNAAGGIHPALAPGSLMAIRGHVALLDREAWRDCEPRTPYSDRLLRAMQAHESAAGRVLLAGTYAALTGPSYETPAEIRALAAMGADAVGMSTAKEAEAAAALGLEVAAVSCITNRAAGLSDALLEHGDVLVNANLAVERLAGLIGHAIRSVPGLPISSQAERF